MWYIWLDETGTKYKGFHFPSDEDLRAADTMYDMMQVISRSWKRVFTCNEIEDVDLEGARWTK